MEVREAARHPLLRQRPDRHQAPSAVLSEPDVAEVRGVVDVDAVRRVAAFLDVELDMDRDLESVTPRTVPPMWHLCLLNPVWRSSELGPDGHPQAGVPTPSAPGLRRMFAGGWTRHLSPLRIGEAATRTSRVTSTTEKDGRRGRLTFVTVRDEITQGRHVAVVEERDIVYVHDNLPGRATSAPERDEPPPEPSPDPVGEQWDVSVDTVSLFRFSALTDNAHRIHYDRDYAALEGHHDVVVHGPLQILLMAEVHRRRGVSFSDKVFRYRMVAPAIGPQTLRVRDGSNADAAPLEIWDDARRLVAMSTLDGLA